MALDPQVATAALIDALGAQTLAKAAAYTAGKHWLLLWDLIVTGLATWAPVMNTLSRTSETEADRHSLETVNLPDALASALVKTAEYRDPRPNPLQEVVFYTHPAVERRVLAAMQWKASGRTAAQP
jgi:Zn-dependent protease with chaperone function